MKFKQIIINKFYFAIFQQNSIKISIFNVHLLNRTPYIKGDPRTRLISESELN